MVAALKPERPKFELGDISTFYSLVADGIKDLNTDAFDAVCKHCQARLSWGQWLNSKDYRKNVVCHICGKAIFYRDHSEWPMPSYHQYLVRHPDFFDRQWYHATTKRDWVEAVQEAANGKLLIHAGSKISALYRATRFLNRALASNISPVSIYAFKLKSTMEFSTTIYDDMGDDWPDRLGDGFTMKVSESTNTARKEKVRREPMGKGILGVPYYNRYEVPGEISILFSSILIDPTTVEVTKISHPR